MADEFLGHLLGAPEIDDRCKELLHKYKNIGFEYCLSILQREGSISLKNMESAVTTVFDRMRTAFLNSGGMLEFRNAPHEKPSHEFKGFLAGFDAIFSLNQDLLLEIGYFPWAHGPRLTSEKWAGCSLPGMERLPEESFTRTDEFTGSYVPTLTTEATKSFDNMQPIYKLHGSINWFTSEGGRLLIMGGDKADAIEGSNLLKSYAGEFDRQLREPGTRLMIIGYGFRDSHINSAIEQAAADGSLKIFIVDPHGYNAPNPNRPDGILTDEASPMPHTQRNIVGFARQRLSEIFGDNSAERANIFQFLKS